MLDLQTVEIFFSFALVGFITWYGTGLDDLLFMSVIFKKKSHDQKVIMFFGNLTAVFLIVSMAAFLSRFSQGIENTSFFLRLPGLIPIMIGFLEVNHLVKQKRRKKIKRKLDDKNGYQLFSFAFFLYVFNSIDDFVVTSSIFFTNSEWIKIVPYGLGFVFGSAVSLYLASKFSRITQKISFLEYLAPVVLIIVGTLIFSGVLIHE